MKKLHSTAQGLAALGRNGDSMLVHMQPREVEGLQALAAANGTSLTVNPHTGLPEAFSIGRFLSSLLPTAVGAITAPFLGPYGAVLAGAATGAATNRDNPLMGAVSGGLGAWGGSGLSDAALKSAAATGSTQVTQQAANAAAGNIAPLNQAAEVFGQAAPSVSSTGVPLANAGQEAVENAANIAKIGYQAPTGLSGVAQGIQGLGTEAGRGAFVNALGGPGQAAFKVGAPLAMATLSGMEPTAVPQEDDKYDPYAKLNLGYSSGLRFLAEGGDINETPDPGSNPVQDAQETQHYGIGGLSYAGGGGVFGGQGLNLNTVDAPPPNRFGLMGAFMNRQPYQRPIQTNALPFYGMLNRTIQPVQAPPPPPGPFAQSGKPMFAKGGYLDGPGDGMSDSIPATIGDKQPARLADGEFVVSADVVSGIGNGSTKAGAKRLYAMMDRVRKARTGTTKQGKEIEPEKYMPA